MTGAETTSLQFKSKFKTLFSVLCNFEAAGATNLTALASIVAKENPKLSAQLSAREYQRKDKRILRSLFPFEGYVRM